MIKTKESSISGIRRLTFFLYFIVLNSIHSSTINLLNNGNFEAENPNTDTPPWNSYAIDISNSFTGFAEVFNWKYENFMNTGITSLFSYGGPEDWNYVLPYSPLFGARYLLFGGANGTGNGISQQVYLNRGNYKFSIYAGEGNGSFIFEAYDYSTGHALTNLFGRSQNILNTWAKYEMEFEILSDMPVKIVLRDGPTNPGGYIALDYAVLETIPEPSALSLLAVGLGGLALIRRRRS